MECAAGHKPPQHRTRQDHHRQQPLEIETELSEQPSLFGRRPGYGDVVGLVILRNHDPGTNQIRNSVLISYSLPDRLCPVSDCSAYLLRRFVRQLRVLRTLLRVSLAVTQQIHLTEP